MVGSRVLGKHVGLWLPCYLVSVLVAIYVGYTIKEVVGCGHHAVRLVQLLDACGFS